MFSVIGKIIISYCLFCVIIESSCKTQKQELDSKIGNILKNGIIPREDVTEELSTNWVTEELSTNWVTEELSTNWVTEGPSTNWVTEGLSTNWVTGEQSTNWVTEEQSTNWVTDSPTEDSSQPTTAAPIHSECGGIIEIHSEEPAVIEYKLRENYNDNEMCIWTIRNHDYSLTELRTLQFRKTESNFELDFDFLQISSFEKNSYSGPTQSDKIGRINGPEVVNFTGPVAFVVFSSDGSDVGMGFRIEISTQGDQHYNHEVLNYFSSFVSGAGSLQPYLNNLMATFVISPENSPKMFFYLYYLLDYPATDFIRVYRVERNGGLIRYILLEILDNVGGRWYILNGYASLVFILESNASNLGEGLSFEWYDSL